MIRVRVRACLFFTRVVQMTFRRVAKQQTLDLLGHHSGRVGNCLRIDRRKEGFTCVSTGREFVL
jgi:hypothetical protein